MNTIEDDSERKYDTWVSVKGQAFTRIFGRGGREVAVRVGVDLIYLTEFPFPVFRGVLDNAKRIDPDIATFQLPGDN